MRKGIVSIGIAAACLASSPAFAAQVMDGTVSSVGLFNPNVVLSTNPSSYSAMNGGTFEISGTGGFSNVGGTFGTLNGTLLFSNTIGAITAQSVPNFFVFSDASGGNYRYSVTSVQTNAFVNQPGITSSGTLYLLGSIIDPFLGFNTPTASSLTIQFNSTANSRYSSALTLSVPAAITMVPEPATWAMMLIGFGAAGVTMRRKRAPLRGVVQSQA